MVAHMTERLPMLAAASTATGGRQPIDVRKLVETGDWILDAKLDGVRAWLMPDGRILNRKGVDVTYKFPEIENPSGAWLDGEIVAEDGTFETTLVRESQENRAQIRLQAETMPCRFIAFDAPEFAGLTWDRRRNFVERVNERWGVEVTPYSDDASFMDEVQRLGMEGVIAKRRASRYEFNRRSQDWVKWKNVRRVTCIGFAYSQGNGSRAHFGSLHLALLRDGEPVEVGRTGSGFTDAMTHRLKERLDAGEYFACEVEYLHLTSGGQLRFPTFKGLRSDVALDDCTYDQLERA